MSLHRLNIALETVGDRSGRETEHCLSRVREICHDGLHDSRKWSNGVFVVLFTNTATRQKLALLAGEVYSW